MNKYRGGRRIASLAIGFGWLFALVGGAMVLFGILYVALLPLIGVYGAKLSEGFPVMLCVVVGGLLLIVSGWASRALFDISDKLHREADA